MNNTKFFKKVLKRKILNDYQKQAISNHNNYLLASESCKCSSYSTDSESNKFVIHLIMFNFTRPNTRNLYTILCRFKDVKIYFNLINKLSQITSLFIE